MQKPLKDAVAPLTEMEKEIKGSIKEVTDSVNGIGKPQKEAPKSEPKEAAPAPEAAPEAPTEQV